MHITLALRQAAIDANLSAAGYPQNRISSHSLRASRAMALKLAGYDSNTIKKVGRWSSGTFLTYIHSQISAFSQGLAEAMSTPRIFYNVGG